MEAVPARCFQGLSSVVDGFGKYRHRAAVQGRDRGCRLSSAQSALHLFSSRSHSPSRSISQSGSQSVRARGPGRQRHTASPATSRRTNESLPQVRNLPPSSFAVLLCNSRVTIHRPSFGDGLRSVRTLWQHTSARACDFLPSALEGSKHDRSI